MLTPDWRPSTRVYCSCPLPTTRPCVTWWLTWRGRWWTVVDWRSGFVEHFSTSVLFFIFFCFLQGDAVWKVQFNELREPGDRLRSHAHAAAGDERSDDAERHEAAEAGGAAHDRARRRAILTAEASTAQKQRTLIYSVKEEIQATLMLMKFSETFVIWTWIASFMHGRSQISITVNFGGFS